MRIAYLADHSSVHTRRWVSFFAARGHEVHVVTCGGADAVDLDGDGLPLPRRYVVHDLGRPRLGKAGYFLKLWKARRTVRRLQPEVLHVHWLTSYGLLGLATGVEPLVATAHGDDLLIAPGNPLLYRIVRRVLQRAQVVTVPAEHMRDAVLDLVGDDPDRQVAVFQYGVESDRLQAVGERVRTERADELAGVPGRDRPARLISARALLGLYRIDALLDAMSLLLERGVQAHLDIVGDGPLRDRLQNQAMWLGLDEQVTWHGHLPPSRVEELVAAADAYVSVASSDGVSLALLEAMALGTVPVLSDIPANRGWVHDGETGVLVPIEAPAIAAGVERALQLDRARVAVDNHAIVAERADRDTNLGECELLIDDVAGVTFDPEPVDEHADGARGADAA